MSQQPAASESERSSFVADAIRRAGEWTECHAALTCLAFGTLLLILCLGLAATKLLWYDELATYLPGIMPLDRLLEFFRQGRDVHPPTPSLLVHAATALFRSTHPAVARLPFVLSFLAMHVSIYRFVLRRCPAMYALLATAVPATATSFFFYATEIRGYALMLGATAVAMVCWQRIVDGRRPWLSALGLWLCLSFGIASHFFAVVLLIPFGLAELWRLIERRRVDWITGMAIVGSLWPMAAFWPGMKLARAYYGPGMWSRPSVSALQDTYQTMLNYSWFPLLIGTVIWLLLWRAGRTQGRAFAAPVSEQVLVIGVALVPVFGLALSIFTGSYLPRFASTLVIGVAIFLAFALARATRSDLVPATVLALVLVGYFAFKTTGAIKRQAAENGGIRNALGVPYRQQPWMKELERNDLPIVSTTAPFSVQFAYYSAPSIGARSIYLADRELASQWERTDTGDSNMLAFREPFHWNVAEYREFIASHDHFMICADTTWNTWQIPQLQRDGYELELRTRSGTIFVFEALRRSAGETRQ